MHERADASHGLDDRIRLLMAVAAVVVTVTLPPWRALGVAAAGVILVLAAAQVPLKQWLRRFVPGLTFLALIGALIPFSGSGGAVAHLLPGGHLAITSDGLHRWALVMSRGLIAISWLAILGATTSPERIFGALAGLHVPARLVTIAWLTYRYLIVIGDESRRVLIAWRSRRIIPRRAEDLRAIGNIVGVLFIRSVERAERLHVAMQARGFVDTEQPVFPKDLSRRDVTVGALGAVALAVFAVVSHGGLV